MSKRPEPETRKVRIATAEPPRTGVLPDELLLELRRGARAEPRASSPADRRPVEPPQPRTVALRAPRGAAPRALHQAAPRPLETVAVSAAPVGRTQAREQGSWSAALGLALRPRTRLLLAVCVAAVSLAALLVVATDRRRRAAPVAAMREPAPKAAAAAEARAKDGEPPAGDAPAHARATEPISPPASAAGAARRAPDPRAQPRTRDARALARLTETAIDQLARGDDRAALASYRMLSALVPTERAFALVAEVLEQRLAARCGGAAAGEAACAR